MKKTLEITIPVFNEEEELEGSILKLYDFCKKNLGKYKWQITIADNASSDNTPIIATNLSKRHHEIALFRLEERGRGRAVKRAWANSEADYCSYMDLDLSTDLKHLPKLIEALENGYDIAIGSRLAKGA